MRPAPLVLLATCAALGLGCQESGFDERRETARPLKVQHLLGETKVPGQAERPTTIGANVLDNTLALGITPLAAAVPGGRLPGYLGRPAAEVELLPDGEPPPPRTDVIVAAAPVSDAEFLRLRGIAPTVVTDEGGVRWKLNLRLNGEALGRTNDAEALLSDYDERVAQVRRGLPQRVRVAVPGAGDESFAASVLADAGVRRVAPDDAQARLEAPVWTGPGGVFAARAALADLQRVLQR